MNKTLSERISYIMIDEFCGVGEYIDKSKSMFVILKDIIAEYDNCVDKEKDFFNFSKKVCAIADGGKMLCETAYKMLNLSENKIRDFAAETLNIQRGK